MMQILFTSSVLILALFVLRALFLRAIPRRVQYALWALVLLRLLVPFSLPGSAHSLAQHAQGALQTAEAAAAQPIYTEEIGTAPLDAYPEAYGVEPGESFTPRDIPRAYDVTLRPNYAARTESGEEVTLYKALSFASLARLGWYIGMAGMSAWFIVSNLRFAQRLRRSRRTLSEKNRVYVSDEITSPCLFGLIRPAIFVTPEAAADKTRLRHVLIHEQTHKRHLDPLWSLLRAVCLIVWFFDPLVWLAAYVSRIDGELACDEGALAVLGEDERIAYGETLLALVPVRRTPSPMLASTSMASGKKRMRDRITRIAEHKKPLVIALAAVLILAAVIGAACFMGGEKPADPAEDAASSVQIGQNPPIPDETAQGSAAVQSPFSPNYPDRFGLTRAQFLQSERLSEEDVPEMEAKAWFHSLYTHQLPEPISVEGHDFSVLLEFDPWYGGALDACCFYTDPQRMGPEEKYALVMKLYDMLCRAYGDALESSGTTWIGNLASYEDFLKDDHLSASAYWILPGDWTLPNAADVSCTVTLKYAADTPVLEVVYGLSGHWMTPFEKEYGILVPRQLPDDGINDLERVLTALAQEFDGSGLPMEYDAVNRFLAGKPEFLALGKPYADGIGEVVEMLRGGFDLDGTREHFLMHYVVWMLTLEIDPDADFYESLSSETAFYEENADALLYFRLFWTEPAEKAFNEDAADRFMVEDFTGYSNAALALKLLCKLYPGFLPDSAVNTMQGKNAYGEDVTLTFWTQILGSGNSKTARLILSDGVQHYVWSYTLNGHGAVLQDCYLSYGYALRTIRNTHAPAPQGKPADPLYLDYVNQTEAGVLNALGLSEEDLEDTGRVSENENMCILTGQKADLCGRDFFILLGFDKYQDPLSDERKLTRFDYFLPVDALTKEELYALTRDVCASLTDAYGAPRTVIDGTFAEIESLEDFDPEKVYGDRWLVPGNFAIPGAANEKVLCAELLLSPPSAAMRLPQETERVLSLRFYLRDNLSMQLGLDHLLHVGL